MKQNKTLFIIGLIAVVNALGYGIIIPILYSYSLRFGLTVFQNGMLFAIYSLCQFLSAPIIGRMSDKYGRKPLLTLSIAGTALSFFMTAFAPTAAFIFLARALDGLTAGNLPVASAVIADTTALKDRAKGFGIIGAAFGFGFFFGPAISAATYGISPALPFIIAGGISVIATILTMIMLPETNKHIGQVHKKSLFDVKGLYLALFDKNVGKVLLIGLLYAFLFSSYITIFQPYAINVFHFSASQISLYFTMIGLIGIITQILLIGRLSKFLGPRVLFSLSFLSLGFIFAGMFLAKEVTLFVAFGLLYSLISSFINPLIQTILSQETDEKSQGSIQGVSASYMSIGQIIGPILGGFIATIHVSLPFLLCAALGILCFLISLKIAKPHPVIHAFK